MMLLVEPYPSINMKIDTIFIFNDKFAKAEKNIGRENVAFHWITGSVQCFKINYNQSMWRFNFAFGQSRGINIL